MTRRARCGDRVRYARSVRPGPATINSSNKRHPPGRSRPPGTPTGPFHALPISDSEARRRWEGGEIPRPGGEDAGRYRPPTRDEGGRRARLADLNAEFAWIEDES